MTNVADDDLREAMVNAGAGQVIGWGQHSDAYQCIRAALAAADALGYVLAPKVATHAMSLAALRTEHRTGGAAFGLDVWAAMIAARPAVTITAPAVYTGRMRQEQPCAPETSRRRRNSENGTRTEKD